MQAFPILEPKCRVALRLQQANPWVPLKTEEKSCRNPMVLMAEEFGTERFSGTPLYTKEPSTQPDEANGGDGDNRKSFPELLSPTHPKAIPHSHDLPTQKTLTPSFVISVQITHDEM